MISQKEKLVFGILYSLFALALVVCGIMNIITGAWGLAVFVLGVSAFDIWQAIESFRYWFRYKEATTFLPFQPHQPKNTRPSSRCKLHRCSLICRFPRRIRSASLPV